MGCADISDEGWCSGCLTHVDVVVGVVEKKIDTGDLYTVELESCCFDDD